MRVIAPNNVTTTEYHPIVQLIDEIKATKRHAKVTGQDYIYELCENVLELITLFRDDTERLDKIERLNLIKCEDLRAYIDSIKEPQQCH